MTEYEKMHHGMIYDTQDAELGRVQKHSHRLCEQYNRLGVDDEEQKKEILSLLFPGDNFGAYRAMEAPIFIDNCREITIGKIFTPTFTFPLSQAARSGLATTYSSAPTARLPRAFTRW